MGLHLRHPNSLMNGMKFFFLSLVILSLAMGQNWWKNRPKGPPKKPKKIVTSQPVDLEAELASETASASLNASQTANASGSPGVGSETLNASGTPNASDSAVASDTAPASGPLSIGPGDPVIAAWENLARTPFEPSPFIKMLAESGKARENSDGTVVIKRKETRRLEAQFTGVIRTDKFLMAVIDGKWYKSNEPFGDKTIKKLATDVIALEDPGGITYLIPRKGCKVDIASDGSYTVFGDDTKR